MKNQVINTFALIGVITVIAIACSSALSDDDDVIIPSSTTEVAVETNTPLTTTTNTGTTNTSSSGTTTTNTVTTNTVVQNQVGRYQISAADGTSRAWVIDTVNGKYIRLNVHQDGTPLDVGDFWVWHDLPPQ